MMSVTSHFMDRGVFKWDSVVCSSLDEELWKLGGEDNDHGWLLLNSMLSSMRLPQEDICHSDVDVNNGT